MADDTGRRSRTGRTVVVAVAAWLAVVVVASALAWFAIGRAGSEVLDPSVQRLPTTSATGSATTATTPAPSTEPTTDPPATSGPATSSPPTSGPAASPEDEVVTVTGGQAGFRCTGDALGLRFAQPANGWSVSTNDSDGGARIRVEFESDESRYRIEAVCASGVPSTTVEED